MTLHALTSGSLWVNPERRRSQNGKDFVLANLRVKVGNESRFVKVLAFSETVGNELMELRAGDPLSVAGDFKCEIFTPENRGPRLSMTIFCDSIMPLRTAPKDGGGR
jgi:hypothetical protein